MLYSAQECPVITPPLTWDVLSGMFGRGILTGDILAGRFGEDDMTVNRQAPTGLRRCNLNYANASRHCERKRRSEYRITCFFVGFPGDFLSKVRKITAWCQPKNYILGKYWQCNMANYVRLTWIFKMAGGWNFFDNHDRLLQRENSPKMCTFNRKNQAKYLFFK